MDRDALLGQPEYSEAEILLHRQKRELLDAALAGDWDRWTRVRNEMPRQPWMTSRTVDRYGPAFTEEDAPLVSFVV